MSINRLDNEISAFLRAQEYFADTEATGTLEVRCGIPLGDKLDPTELQDRYNKIAELEFEPGHLDYLKFLQFEDAFVEYLSQQQPPRPTVLVRGEDVKVRVTGKLVDLPLWEVPISNQLHDLYFNRIIATNSLDVEALMMEGIRRFRHKADLLRGSRIMFTEAGTRWRYAWDWYVVIFQNIMGDIPNIIEGTTNPWMGLTHAVKASTYPYARVASPSVRDIEEAAYTDPVVVTDVNAYEMAHLHAHFGDLLKFEWGADLTVDMGPGGIPLPLEFLTR